MSQPVIRPFNASMIASKPASQATDLSTSVIENLEFLLAEEFGSSEDRPIAFKWKSQTKKPSASFSELVRKSTAAAIVSAEGTDLVTYLAISSRGMQTLVGYLLGDETGSPPPDDDQKPTPIEISLMQLSARRIAATLTKLSLKDAQGSFQAAALQSDRQSLQTLSTENPVAVYELQVVTPHCTGSVTLAFNAGSYSHFFGQILEKNVDEIKDHSAWHAKLDCRLQEATVNLVARIDGGHMQLVDLAQLHVGAIIPLCREESGAVSLLQNQLLLGKCTLGQADGRFSLRIEEMFDQIHASPPWLKPTGDETQEFLSQGTTRALVAGSRNV